MMTFVLVATVLACVAYAAYKIQAESRHTALAEAWARHLTFEQAEAAFEELRLSYSDYFANPHLYSGYAATQMRERAVAAKGRINQLAGKPYGASFRVNFRTNFIAECVQLARMMGSGIAGR